MTNLYKIKDKEGNLITYKPNYIQLLHTAERGEHGRNLILKFRQGGFTTHYAIELLDESLWVAGTSCGIIAHKAKKLEAYFNIVKRAYVNLPDALKPKTKSDTKRTYEFTHRFDGAILDSNIYVDTDIRGGTVQNLHITESAYIRDRQALDSGSKQAVPITGRISEETTANGFNEFYDFYMRWHGKEPQTPQDYKTFFYSWVQHQEYTLQGTIEEYTETEEKIKAIAKEQFNIDVTDGQLLWRRWKKSELARDSRESGLTGDQLFKQEYPLTILEAFQSASGAVFNQEAVEAIKPKPILTVDEITNIIRGEDYNQHGEQEQARRNEILDKCKTLRKKNTDFYVLPEYGKEYLIGVDPSGGDGGDRGCIDVWDAETLEQVAQFYGKLRPDELADLAVQLGYFYNTAYIGVENNMMSTVLFLWKSGYPQERIYVEYKEDQITKKRTRKIGFNTNTKTRDLMIDEFLILFEEGNLQINSKYTIGEMRTFVVKDNGKREHADGKHDDALFGGFIAIQMRKHNAPVARAFATNPFN